MADRILNSSERLLNQSRIVQGCLTLVAEQETIMAKGQSRSSKEAKKPKDTQKQKQLTPYQLSKIQTKNTVDGIKK